MGTTPKLYRCSCSRLLRRKDIEAGACQGHRVQYASGGSFYEWLKVKYWTLTGQL